MTDIRRVTPDFATAPQLALTDMAVAARQGYRLVINNRPDGEQPGQPTAAQMAQAAELAGLGYVHIPVVGAPTPTQVEAVRAAIAGADGPVLAFCRSGTRSIVAWARGEAAAGAPREALIAAAREAGYDLTGAL